MLQVVPSGEEIACQLISIRQVIDQLEVQFSRLAADLDQSSYWAYEGSNSSIDWIRFNCHMTSNAAADRVAVGEGFGKLSQSVQAMDAGEIGFAHLSVITRTANAVGEAFDESKVLQLARENSPGKFHYKCLHYRHSVDPKKYSNDQAELAGERFLYLNPQEDGSLFLTGLLDPVGGAAVRTALEPLARPSGAHDDRTRKQRLADALVELASCGRPASLQITASVETVKGLAGAPGGESEFSLPISSAAVQGMACDCSVMRVLLDGKSMIVDVGRSKRMIEGSLRKAIRIRDRHCRWPGCERPASWCDGHHLVHWIHGGETNLENLVLLCRRHHRMVHEAGWQLIKTDVGQIVTIAPTITFGLPRGPD